MTRKIFRSILSKTSESTTLQNRTQMVFQCGGFLSYHMSTVFASSLPFNWSRRESCVKLLSISVMFASSSILLLFSLKFSVASYSNSYITANLEHTLSLSPQISWRCPLISCAPFDLLLMYLKWITTIVEPVFEGEPHLCLVMKVNTFDAFAF